MKNKFILVIFILLIGINNVYAKESVLFSDCVDGDTIKIILDQKEYTVRMIAIDTPESVHPKKGVEYYGLESSEYTCNKIKNAKKIEIEYDENSDKLDKYGRIVAWVFIDDNLLQKDLVANGYAKVAYLYDDYKYTKELEKTQELASAKNLGIWNISESSKYNQSNNINEDIEDVDAPEKIKNEETNSYSKKDIIIIVILLIIILFVGNKTIKNKAKKQLKKYLK